MACRRHHLLSSAPYTLSRRTLTSALCIAAGLISVLEARRSALGADHKPCLLMAPAPIATYLNMYHSEMAPLRGECLPFAVPRCAPRAVGLSQPAAPESPSLVYPLQAALVVLTLLSLTVPYSSTCCL